MDPADGRAVRVMGELLELPPDWDSYEAYRVSWDAVQRAMEQLIDVATTEREFEPHVVPTAPGGVQLEWRSAAGELIVHVQADGRVTAHFEDLRDGTEREFAVGDDVSELRSLVARVSSKD